MLGGEPAIRAELSTIPEGVGGDVEEVGEVKAELHEEGVSDPAVAVKTEVDEAVVDEFSAMGFFETTCTEYVGYGLRPLKSRTTMAVKLVRMVLSMVRSQSRYKHISRSI